MTYIDSHAHLTADELYPRVDELLARAQQAGVARVINICTDKPTLERGLVLAQKYTWVHNVAATTPHDVASEGELLFPLMEKHARQGDLVAVGETGLDYHYTHSPRELQKAFLIRYLQLALDCHLPVVIHCREAFADLFEILDAHYIQHAKHAPGILHCFTGTQAEAEGVLARGWYLSMSGIVTFKKSQALRDIAKMVPLEQLLIETDAPYLAPQGHRGAINEPSYIGETAACIAAVKGLAPEIVALASAKNAAHIFNLKNLSLS